MVHSEVTSKTIVCETGLGRADMVHTAVMQRFQYSRRVADSRENRMEAPDRKWKPIDLALEEWGDAGWELVGLATQVDTRSVNTSGFVGPLVPQQFVKTVGEVYVFKRPLA
jgi:hypothetical protein